MNKAAVFSTTVESRSAPYTALGPEPARAVERLGALMQSAYFRAAPQCEPKALDALADTVVRGWIDEDPLARPEFRGPVCAA